MFSLTLGTALGDRMADSAPVGYNGGALLIGGVLAATTAFTSTPTSPEHSCFWASFILTRPQGATIANSLDKPVSKGGLAISPPTIAAMFLALMVACVALIPQRPCYHAAKHSFTSDAS